MQLRRWIPVAVLVPILAALWLTHRPVPPPQPLAAAPMAGEPRLMLWAWETPEDLRALDPSRAGVAFLSRELLLGPQVTVRPRMQPLHITPGTWVMAVVRLEPTSAFHPTDDLQREAVLAIVGALAQPNIRALQIDFDATAAQRPFYTGLLQELRRATPPAIPLSITALVSWCGPGSWLGDLPVAEAVPMFFRMGGPAAARAGRPRSANVIAAPVCRSSVGLSTDEAWPAVHPAQRVYLFRPGPWTNKDIARLNRFGYVGLHESPP